MNRLALMARTNEPGRYRVLIDGRVVMRCKEASVEGGYIIPLDGDPIFGRVTIMDRKAELDKEQGR